MSEKKSETPSIWKRMVSSSSRQTYKDIKKSEKDRIEQQLAKIIEEANRTEQARLKRENDRYDRLYGDKETFSGYDTTQSLRREMARDFNPRINGGSNTRRSNTRRSNTRRSNTRRSSTRRSNTRRSNTRRSNTRRSNTRK
jgi:hypothetical protein